MLRRERNANDYQQQKIPPGFRMTTVEAPDFIYVRGHCPAPGAALSPLLVQEIQRTAFRVLLVMLTLALAGYTGVTIAHRGINLFPDFFGDMAKAGWPGQFNADFTTMLAMSGLWLAWRHHFTPGGIALGVLGFFGGGPMLMTYLLVQTLRANGDMKVILLGPQRAAV